LFYCLVSVYGCCYVSYLHCIIVSFQLLVALIKSYLSILLHVSDWIWVCQSSWMGQTYI